MNISLKYLERFFFRKWNLPLELEVKWSFLWPNLILSPLQHLLQDCLCQRTQWLLSQLFPFKQLWGVLGISFLELKAISSGSHPLVLMLVLGIGLLVWIHIAITSLICVKIPLISSLCLLASKWIPPQFFNFSSWARLSCPQSYVPVLCSSPSTDGTPWTEPHASAVGWLVLSLPRPEFIVPEYSPGLVNLCRDNISTEYLNKNPKCQPCHCLTVSSPCSPLR